MIIVIGPCAESQITIKTEFREKYKSENPLTNAKSKNQTD